MHPKPHGGFYPLDLGRYGELLNIQLSDNCHLINFNFETVLSLNSVKFEQLLIFYPTVKGWRISSLKTVKMKMSVVSDICWILNRPFQWKHAGYI